MSKIYKLKEWLTIREAAKQLSISFGEEVTDADVLHLALDNRLQLSVYFVSQVPAFPTQLVPMNEIKATKAKFPLYFAPVLLDGITPTHAVKWEGTFCHLIGVYDLPMPMIGAERLDVERAYKAQIAGPAVLNDCLEMAFVKGRDGQLYGLFESYETCEERLGSLAQREKLERYIEENHIRPAEAEILLNRYKEKRARFLEKIDDLCVLRRYMTAYRLPRDATLVVRTRVLQEFELSLSTVPVQLDNPIGTTERNTLLTIIAALCRHSGIGHEDRGAASKIARMTDEIGAAVSDDTVRRRLKMIPAALEPRMK